MSAAGFFNASEWLFLFYFAALNGCYLLLNIIAGFNLVRYMAEQSVARLPGLKTDILPPVSIIVPAFNEEKTISETVRALMHLDYEELEVIVVNDGSTDDTMGELRKDFSLEPIPETYWDRLLSRSVEGFYRSRTEPRLRVVEKENGGKADAINAGINIARYPLFCTVDADSMLQKYSLRQVVQPFLDDSRTVASGGTIRVLNGCHVSDGFIRSAGLSGRWLPVLQTVEYLRAFLFGRLGWSPLNALLLLSGAFALFHKESVVAAGGFRAGSVGEDMELVTRLHLYLGEMGKKYRIVFVPDPICWTEVPDSLRVLARQRIRWQRGLAESMLGNLGLLFHPRAPGAGFLSFPFLLIFELIGPVIEVFGYAIVIAGALLGYVQFDKFLLLMSVAIGLGVVLSLMAMLLEEISFHVYKRPGDVFRLFVAALVENFGFRQLHSFWRMIGLIQFFTGTRGKWGEMIRTARWRD